jgi:class 3 adenylate cyclase
VRALAPSLALLQTSGTILAHHPGLQTSGTILAAAFDCAVAMQHATFAHNATRPADEHVLLCLGLGWGDVLLIGDEDVWGREVNVASKLGEDTAKAGQILMSGAARAALGDRPDVTFRPVDERFSAADQNFEAIYPRQI